MENKIEKGLMTFNLSLKGFDGPIDMLLSLVREQKIDITKIQILPLAEQYLLYLKKAIKEDIDLAAEYLVIGAVLTYIKSKLLLPKEEQSEEDPEILSELLKFQILKLETFQNLTKRLFSRPQLGKNFYSRGFQTILKKTVNYKYEINLYKLTSVYAEIQSNKENTKLTIAHTNLYSVEQALVNLKKLLSDTEEWESLLSFIPKNIVGYLEYKSVLSSYFVASLELIKEGKIKIKQDLKNNNNLQIIKNN
ncbi:MAG: segregation/condensation protein A [SAR116 cluster bacterium]|nr:segregation/condensation protein A [SAR116 cluster bacterium]